MEEEKILENITKSISERLKAPIISTYVCVLVLYNWDILFFLFFENSSASFKIQSIKNEYGSVYYTRIIACLIISVTLLITFTVLNTLINFCLKWFYRKDKEITSEIESYEKVNILTEQLSNSINEIKILNSQVENLKNINNRLSAQNTNFSISDISKKDYNNLIDFLNTKSNKEKLIFSLKELISKLKNDPKTSIETIYSSSTYEKDMQTLVYFLEERNLLKRKNLYYENSTMTYQGFELSTSFKDFLENQTA